MRRTFLRAVFRWYERRAARSGLAEARSGGVNFVQRFASALNLDIHFHALILDGVYTSAFPWEAPEFHPLSPPTDEGEVFLCRTVRDRVLCLLQRRDLVESDNEGVGENDEEPALFALLAAASIQGRVALGERASRAESRLGSRSGQELSFVPGELCAAMDGFTLHATRRGKGACACSFRNAVRTDGSIFPCPSPRSSC